MAGIYSIFLLTTCSFISHTTAEVEYALASIEKRMVVDPCEQYARPLGVPYKKPQVGV